MIATLDVSIPEFEPAYFTFRPRPNQPERYDEQEAFYNSKTTGVAFHVGGNGSGTTEVALAKIAKFVLRDQPPPRKDTPFWIISDTYEQVMATAWKEKLYGHGHIPGSEVDWDRIRWYSNPAGWPYEVPLKPWPGEPDRNWSLVFKSYDQGRQSFQAQAIGGFCFIEQFPWGLMEEVLRGCREYNFPGSKFAEFTPIDPALSVEIEEMLENGPDPGEDRIPDTRYIPDGWEFFRANTLCAMEAGHVSPEWYREFFGVIPDEMREVRQIGAFATFRGQIYKGFNPRIHLVDDDVMFPGTGRSPFGFPDNVWFRRGIDWGAGPDNAFCCIWAYKNGLGQWFIFDEYFSTEEKTTIDHLCEVADRWPWPERDPHYGVAYADPSSPDNIRIAQKLPQYTNGEYGGLSMMRGANAVLEGIEHVQWLLQPNLPMPGTNGQRHKVPRIFIHKRNCPNLSREMRTYRWLAPNERVRINPKDPKREPLKKDDHAVDGLRYLVFTEALQTGLTPTSVKREDRSASRGVHLHK